ncbi:hypothetical protein EJ02DRAFT_453660 [Clathrospora elynae]|uniref:Uncharacterized protein n=1 Tax=Clathrospora elynae TaxID=706981 RepID=A0A6A5SU14_9PLEO|nr:hypothetical protein EJ02DRAFT_453660 [Clathrospora elynae]
MSRTEEQNRKIKDILPTLQDEGAQIDQIAKIRGWFRPKDDSPVYPVVQNYLNDKIQLDEASSKLFGPIDEKIIACKLDDVNYMDIWYSVIHSAKRISAREVQQHDRLVDLITAFKEHSIPDNEKYNYLYREMIDFDMACREAYNDAPTAHNGFIDVEIDAWANMNFFFARVVDKGLHDLSLYAIFAMREALETPPDDDDQATASQKYGAYVPAAATWLSGFGPNLFKKQKDLTPTDRKQGSPARGGELWKGKAEFSQERWRFWKERFAQISKMEGGVAEKTKEVAKDAVETMERSETFEHVL